MDYNSNFQDNIASSLFNSTSKNILNWIEENREQFDYAKDPNVYEMINLFLFGSKYLHEGQSIDLDTLSKIWNIRSKDFARCNVHSNNYIYQICQDAFQSCISGKPMVNDENSHHSLRKIAGIGLYLKQQQRDTGIISYNNPSELVQLLKCSKSLKRFHPDLFDKYCFKENIDILCRLQLQHDLPDELTESIKNSKEQLYNNKSTQNLNISQDNNIEK